MAGQRVAPGMAIFLVITVAGAQCRRAAGDALEAVAIAMEENHEIRATKNSLLPKKQT